MSRMSTGASKHERKLHLDRRAAVLLDAPGDPDELLTTAEVANWLGVSPQWVEIGRTPNYA